ncbi:disease resistance CC-NBS-LRR class family protein [Tanacetum coccineum]|uniref:Disease resistance CC-NBS-LRR class family protein n=1 Tax=Tanacetum coccineum TaxID=301880 RepID=A0ABQ5I0U2_9ASTR
MKNHETRPTGTAPLSEANATTYDDHMRRGRVMTCGLWTVGRGHGLELGSLVFGRGRGHSRGRGFGRGDFQGVNHAQFKNTVDLYQKSIKNKGSGAEANFVHDNEAYDSLNDPKDPTDATHLDKMDRILIDNEDICLVDSATTHTILKKEKYFSHMNLHESNVSTISGSAKLIKGSGIANILLPGGTQFKFDNALFSPMSQRNLLSFKDIRKNGYHIETVSEGHIECLHITNMISGKKHVLEKLPALSSGLYYTQISAIESNAVINHQVMDRENFIVWHDRLGHPGSMMMRKIIENSRGHSLKNHKILQSKDITCVACSQGKLITRPSPAKVKHESLNFLERIQGDICGTIHPPCGPFSFAWGHAILHAATLIRIRPTSYHTYSPLQLVFGQEPNISHLRIFGCAVYVPIAPPQRTKMGPQKRL